MTTLRRIPFSSSALTIGLVLLIGGPACADSPATPTAKSKDKWAPFRHLLGQWKGVGRGPTGEAVQESEWKLVLNGAYLQRKSSSEAPGDHHQDMGLISYDAARKKYIYRAFHSEGFVNRYVTEFSRDGKKITFTSEAIENGPKGLKAIEIVELKDGKLKTTLKLASRDGPYSICAAGELKRKKTDRQD